MTEKKKGKVLDMPKVPTKEEQKATAGILRNIAELLKKGMFFGRYSVIIAQAIQFCEQNAAQLDPNTEEENEIEKAGEGDISEPT